MLKIDSQLLLLKLSTITRKSTVVSYTFKRLHCTLKFKEMSVDSFLSLDSFWLLNKYRKLLYWKCLRKYIGTVRLAYVVIFLSLLWDSDYMGVIFSDSRGIWLDFIINWELHQQLANSNFFKWWIGSTTFSRPWGNNQLLIYFNIWFFSSTLPYLAFALGAMVHC